MPSSKLPEFRTAFAMYRSQGILGEGGAGRVHSAQDESGNLVAVKVLDPKKATRSRLKRFKNELFFGLNRRHRNLVRVLDYGVFATSDEASPFYVMPRYGGSLRKAMGPALQGERALKLFAEMLDGVEAAHKLGVIHRDLKPENILIGSDGEPIIADFGIAHFEEEALYTSVETRDGDRLANANYAAPEQRVRGAKVDNRADIFALGLLLCELFTGSVPFGTGYRLPSQSDVARPWLDSVVAQMIQHDPGARPNTIADVRALLRVRADQFDTAQKISALNGEVVGQEAIDDPLAIVAPRIVEVDYVDDQLVITLDVVPSPAWENALHTLSGYRYFAGIHPRAFKFLGPTTRAPVREGDAQLVLDLFKEWLPMVTERYAWMLAERQREQERLRTEAIRQERETLERRERVRSSLKF